MAERQIEYIHGRPGIEITQENLRKFVLSLVEGFPGDKEVVDAEIERLGGTFIEVLEDPNTVAAFEGERCLGMGSFFKAGEVGDGKDVLMYTKFVVLPEARNEGVILSCGISLIMDIAEQHPGALICGVTHGVFARKYCAQMGYEFVPVNSFFEMRDDVGFFDDEWELYVGDTAKGSFSYDSELFQEAKPVIAAAIARIFGKEVVVKES